MTRIIPANVPTRILDQYQGVAAAFPVYVSFKFSELVTTVKITANSETSGDSSLLSFVEQLDPNGAYNYHFEEETNIEAVQSCTALGLGYFTAILYPINTNGSATYNISVLGITD